jgi:hypothetical protein
MQQLIIIMEDSKTLLWSPKFARAFERISSEFIQIEHAPSKMFANPCLITILKYATLFFLCTCFSLLHQSQPNKADTLSLAQRATTKANWLREQFCNFL